MQQKLNVARMDPLVQENNKKKAIRKLALIALLDTLLREEKKYRRLNQNVQCRKMAPASRNLPLKL